MTPVMSAVLPANIEYPPFFAGVVGAWLTDGAKLLPRGEPPLP
jgi:hypothetical protein